MPELLSPRFVLDVAFNRNPDLLPTLPRSENGGFTVVEEHLSKYVQTWITESPDAHLYAILRNGGHPNFSHDYARDILGGSLSQPFDNDGEEEDFSRPETPPARQSSLPPGHEDENGLEYPEHEIEIRSDFTVPPDYAALRSDDSTFDRSGVDLRITSDTGLLFPPSEEELARISREFKREVVHSTAALAMQPPADPPRFRHPLAQSYVPSSSPGLFTRPEPQHLVPPRPVLRTPSPHRTVVGGKRKRVSTPEDGDEGNSVGNAARRPIVITNPEDNAFRQVMTRDDEGRVSPKRRRLQPSRGFHMLVEGDCVPTQPRAGAPTCDNSPEASSHASDKQASHPSIAASQIQKEDSELEKSQVFEMLSKGIEQGDSGDEEESTTNILGGLNESRRSLPALTLDNTQGTSVDGTRSRVATPIKSLLPTEVPTTIPDDVFGPVILSGKANKISDRLPPVASKKSNHGDFVTSDSENEIANVSSKSARFSLDGRAEKEHKVFRKTPFKPRPSSRVMEAEAALAAEVDDDVLKPLASPKKKRAIGARGRKPKPAPSIEAEPSPENGPPSISANNSPSKRRRGRSVQPGVPALPKTPVRRSTRNRK